LLTPKKKKEPTMWRNTRRKMKQTRTKKMRKELFGNYEKTNNKHYKK
jgi:hypothetical protein